MNKKVDDIVIKILSERTDKNLEHTKNLKINELGLDSLSFIEALVALEDALNISFSDEELDYYKYTDVNNLICKVKTKTSGIS